MMNIAYVYDKESAPAFASRFRHLLYDESPTFSPVRALAMMNGCAFCVKKSPTRVNRARSFFDIETASFCILK